MKRLFRIIFASIFLALTATAAYPCSCEFWKPQKKLRKASAVFVGEVVEIGTNNTDRFLTVSIKFKVDRYWKGIKESQVTVISAAGICCTCGLRVEIGGKFLIYAFKFESGQLETSLCMSLRLDSEVAADEIKILGRGKTLKPQS